MKKMRKIIIEVSGGVVQQVVANDGDIQVEILDHDDVNDCDTTPEDRKKADSLLKEMENMVIVY
jgi:hypothetical protein